MSKHHTIYFFWSCFLLLAVITACTSGTDNKTENVSRGGGDSLLAWLDQQVYTDTTKAESYAKRAGYYVARKQYEMARLDMAKAISIDSVNADYYTTMGDILFFGGQPYMSKKALERALQCDVNHKTALFKMAQLLFYVKQYDEALTYCGRLNKVEPDEIKNTFLSGMIYKEKGDTTMAVRTFQKCTEIDNKNYDAFMQLGVIFGVRNNKLALGYYDAALRVRPQSVEALYGKAMYYQDATMYDEAIQTYTTINQIDPKFRDAYFNIGYIHLINLKTYAAAIPYFSKAIGVDSMYYQAYYNRGYCLELLGDINNARTDYQKALDLNPAYQKSREALRRVGL